MSERILKVFTDGASRGNPGNAAIGIAIFDENEDIISSHKEFLGKTTNNYAEYSALLKSLDLLKELETSYDKIEFYSDSELLVNQLTGRYIIRNENLKELAGKFMREIKLLGKRFEIFHVRREKNKIADKLANEAIDAVVKKPAKQIQ